MDAKELGRQVLAKRKETGLSQEKLGEKAGISRNYVSQIERGEADSISIKVINKLAVALGVSPAQLTGEVSSQSMAMIPQSLRDFGYQDNVSYKAIDKLANLTNRGKEPKTVEEWRQLYDAIKSYIEGEEKA